MIAGLVGKQAKQKVAALWRVQPVFCLKAPIRIAAGIWRTAGGKRGCMHECLARGLDLVARKKSMPWLYWLD
jgi:hypothetical protein